MLKKRTDFLVLLNIFILLGMSFLGSIDGVAHDVVYILVFLLPAVAVFAYEKGAGGEGLVPFTMKRKDLKSFLPLVFPTVFEIILLSVVTTALLGLFGKHNSVIIYDTFSENLLRHALLPSILEELAFRYVPLVLLSRYSKRICIIASSVLFATIHANLFQIPYAFLAGAIFITIDIIYDSVLPSIILHLVNNTISVISIYYNVDYPIFIAVFVLAAVSFVFLYKKRDSYLGAVCALFNGKCEEKLSFSLLFVVIPTLILAILNLVR